MFREHTLLLEDTIGFSLTLNRMSLQVITYGATITSIKTPDHQGKIEDVALGFDDMAGGTNNIIN